MKLIIILISLGLERYFGLGTILKRFNWFNKYVEFLKKQIKSDKLWKGAAAVALVIVPIVLVVGIIDMLFKSLFYDTVGMVFGFFVFLYSLGPEDFFRQFSMYFSAKQQNNEEDSAVLASHILEGAVPSAENQLNRAITKKIITQSNDAIFAVIFWFFLLGPVGAFLYRVSSVLRGEIEKRSQEFDASFLVAATKWHQLLEWIPARITAILFGVAGNLTSTISNWGKLFASNLQQNQNILVDCGLAALNISDDNATLEENRAAMTAVDRVLIIELVLLAVFALGALFY